MSHAISPEHLTEALVRVHQRWQQPRGQNSASASTVPTAFTIAVSRETGTYGAAIAREVATRLNWPTYDRELLQRIADDLGVHRTLLESVDERRVGWLRESLASFFSAPKVSDVAYFRKLVETLLSLATHGECVIVGRGATVVLPVATTLRIRVVAPLEDRIRAIQRERSMTVADATSEIEIKDRERNRFVADHFRIDPTNAANYDLVLNAARFETGECADMVIAALDRLRSPSRSSRTPQATQVEAEV